MGRERSASCNSGNEPAAIEIRGDDVSTGKDDKVDWSLDHTHSLLECVRAKSEILNLMGHRQGSAVPVYGGCRADTDRDRVSKVPNDGGSDSNEERDDDIAQVDTQQARSTQRSQRGRSATRQRGLDSRGDPEVCDTSWNHQDTTGLPGIRGLLHKASDSTYDEVAVVKATVRRTIQQTIIGLHTKNDRHASPEEVRGLPLHIKRVTRVTLTARWRNLLWIEDTFDWMPHLSNKFLRILTYIRDQARRMSLRGPRHPLNELSIQDLSQLRRHGLLSRVKPAKQLGLWTVPTFSVPELHKKRRRWITHLPTDAKDTCPVSVKCHTSIKLASLVGSASASRYQYAGAVDFTAYYQQFELGPSFELFAIQHLSETGQSETFRLLTVPTGSNWAPALAQIWTYALIRLALRDCAGVFFDAYIDNVRFYGDLRDEVTKAMSQLYIWCRKFGTTVNEPEEDALAQIQQQTKYTFLGIEFDHSARKYRLAEKGRLALENMIIPSGDCTIREYLSLYGKLTHAALVYGFTRAPFYFATKFLRRVAATNPGSLDDRVRPWHCATTQLQEWRESVLALQWQSQHVISPAVSAVMYTDASWYGWGVTCFFSTGQVAIFADKFKDDMIFVDINIKETYTVFRAIASLHLQDRLKELTAIDLRIDNTAALGSLRKEVSKNYSINYWVMRTVQLPRWRIVRSLQYVRSANNLADLPSRISVDGFWFSWNPFLWPSFIRHFRENA